MTRTFNNGGSQTIKWSDVDLPNEFVTIDYRLARDCRKYNTRGWVYSMLGKPDYAAGSYLKGLRKFLDRMAWQERDARWLGRF
jgi:hypothetical protein